MNFEQAVKFVLKYEGGYTNDPNDPGGETNFGISKKSYPMLDIKSLNEAAATVLYKRDFWDKAEIEKLPEDLRLIFFDGCVNHGIHAAVSILQMALDIKVDGVLGPDTISASFNVPSQDLVKHYSQVRLSRYCASANFDRYGKGWVRRLMDVTVESIRV